MAQAQTHIPTYLPFTHKLAQAKIKVQRRALHTLQVNIGKTCNQACHHCHVDSGPKRTEQMKLDTVKRLLSLIRATPNIKTIDITGGAPEINPHFRYLVSELTRLGKTVIDRCNLTILFEPGQEDTAQFLADQQVNITASLPCYTKNNVDKQRGNGTFAKSIRALQQLNQLGYGAPNSGLILNLVYNPLGPHLPPDQNSLAIEYQQRLKADFGISFNQLFTLTNLPIHRFAHDLIRSGQYQAYMQLLEHHFNPKAAQEVMCTEMVSISWDGFIYDCDFNQMLMLNVGDQKTSLWDIDNFNTLSKNIKMANHCYGCTAGAGSSCSGALTS